MELTPLLEVTADIFKNLYKEKQNSNFYMMAYPNRLQIIFILVLNDSGSFKERLDLETNLKLPSVLYNVLTDQTIEMTQDIVKNVVKFYTIETFELFKTFVDNARMFYKS